jgi:hypothetical protein
MTKSALADLEALLTASRAGESPHHMTINLMPVGHRLLNVGKSRRSVHPAQRGTECCGGAWERASSQRDGGARDGRRPALDWRHTRSIG